LAIVGTVLFVIAGAFERGVATAAEVVPADDILMIVSEMGLAPSTQVQPRGAYYVVHAVDPRGLEVRVVADIRSGTILSVIPLQGPEVQAPSYNGSARIIHVPRTDDGGESTVVYRRHDRTPPPAGIAPGAAPRRTTSAPPPAPVRRRSMLNAPREEDRALTPICPTPRFDAAAEAMEKFERRGDDAAAITMPPAED
jgi:hypothetical protein